MLRIGVEGGHEVRWMEVREGVGEGYFIPLPRLEGSDSGGGETLRGIGGNGQKVPITKVRRSYAIQYCCRNYWKLD